MEAMIASGTSYLMLFFLTETGAIIAVTPIMASVLNILLPTTFPMAMSVSPDNAAIQLTTSSGADVPKATIVSPITRVEMLNL